MSEWSSEGISDIRDAEGRISEQNLFVFTNEYNGSPSVCMSLRSTQPKHPCPSPSTPAAIKKPPETYHATWEDQHSLYSTVDTHEIKRVLVSSELCAFNHTEHLTFHHTIYADPE